MFKRKMCGEMHMHWVGIVAHVGLQQNREGRHCASYMEGYGSYSMGAAPGVECSDTRDATHLDGIVSSKCSFVRPSKPLIIQFV